MLRSLTHRGPDESGSWAGDGVGLGIARLSIIDVSEGHQPVFSTDNTVIAVFNGEIYNYRELARDLVASGEDLRSSSDAEVIPHLFLKYGLDFVHRLRGMFAIALWDDNQKRLILVRDRVGKKPLVFVKRSDGILFASEPKALFAAGWRADADPRALDHVMAFGYGPPDGGAFERLKSLPPGSGTSLFYGSSAR